MGVFKKGDKLNGAKLPREKFKLPEVDADTYVIVRAMSQKEVMDWIVRPAEEAQRREKAGEPPLEDTVRVDFTILSLCVVDDEGAPIFTDAADAQANFDVSADSIKRIVEKVVKLSGMEKDRSGK